MARFVILMGLVVLAGCARSEEASLTPNANELEAVERVRTPEQDDEEIALGQWRDTVEDNAAALEFGSQGAPPLFSLRCDARRGVFLQRHGAAPTGDLPMMLISIGSETRRLAVTNVAGATPLLRAQVASSDTLIRTLSNAATPITIRIGDAPPLVLPPNPNFGTYLGRCATGPEQADGNQVAEANESSDANAAAPAPPPARR